MPNVPVLEQYLDILHRSNALFNLTGIKDRRQLASELLPQALAFIPHIPEGAAVADIGGGNGIPGVVISIVRPDVRVTVIERSEKKRSFLRELKYQLGLGIAIEERGIEELTDGKWDVVVGVKVANLPTFLVLAGKILKPGGRVIYPIPDEGKANPGKKKKAIDNEKCLWYYSVTDGLAIAERCST